MNDSDKIIAVVSLFFYFLLSPVCSAAPESEDTKFLQMVENYSQAYKALRLPELKFSYVEMIESELAGPDSRRQRKVFEQYESELRAIDSTRLSSCYRVFYQTFAYELKTNLWRLDLLERHRKLADAPPISQEGIFHQPLGREWYEYLLERWVNIDWTPEQVHEFGLSQLSQALSRYDSLQKQLGFHGKTEAFYRFLASDLFRYEEDETPLAEYKENQAIVWKNLERLFYPYPIEPAEIVQSTLGDAMPVDAFYEDDEEIFYFNKLKEGFRMREVDLVFLHEATPGHHFQNIHKNQVASCNTLLPGVYYHAYTEGWGTYSELLGKRLGLYKEPTDYLGWVEWDIVRSIRVIIDIKLNYYGWTSAEALEFWLENAPMSSDIAEREIERIRSWPAQAVTYKVGAHIFKVGREAFIAAKGRDADIREFHDLMLRHGALPLQVLQSILDLEV